MSRHSLSLLCSTAALLVAANLDAQVTMTPLPGFGVNGWIAPGTHPYVSTGNTERGLAFNPTTGNLVLVARQAVAGVSNNIRVLSGTTGADLFGLDNTALTGGGTFPINMVGVAEDGAIYVGNLSTSATTAFVVYKWDSELWGQTNPPSIAFSAVTGLVRTGDAFAIHGGLTSPTQFATAGSNNTVTASNSYFATGTVDATNSFTNYTAIPGTATANNDYRLALTYVDQSTLIGTQGATARLTAFGGGVATVTASIPLGGASRRAMAHTVIGGTPVLAVIDTVSSQVTVLSLADPFTPVVLATGNNTVAPLTANANGTGSVAWGPVLGNSAVLYAMSSNQGIQAFQVTLNPLAFGGPYGVGCDGLLHTAVGLPTIGNSGFQLAVAGVSPISPIAFVAFGGTVINPGIDLTFIGMPGCFGYNSFDIGLFATGPVGGGIGFFPLAIPNDVNLAGSAIASQGVALTLSTPASLASSDGLLLNLGF